MTHPRAICQTCGYELRSRSHWAACSGRDTTSPAECVCADPVLDSIGQCQRCHRKYLGPPLTITEVRASLDVLAEADHEPEPEPLGEWTYTWDESA